MFPWRITLLCAGTGLAAAAFLKQAYRGETVMRMFFGAVGVLAWIWALAVLWIFAESGGALTIIAAGIYAVVAMVALGCERVLKTLEDIRDGRVETPRPISPRSRLMARTVNSRDVTRVETGPVHTATP